MTPFASVAMLEKLALLKIARCRAPALSSASSACWRAGFRSRQPRQRGCNRYCVAALKVECDTAKPAILHLRLMGGSGRVKLIATVRRESAVMAAAVAA